jgi:IS30 family transposase
MPAHLTLEDRDRIGQLVERGYNQSEIAKLLDRSQATISRELSRNSKSGEYLSGQAQQSASTRRSRRTLTRKMDRPEIQDIVRSGLARYWSPEQIAGRICTELPDRPELWVTAPTIYTWISQQGEYREHWQKFLRRRGKRTRKKAENQEGSRKSSVSDRPQVIEDRGRVGDFEGDTVLGPPGTGGVITIVDRKSRYTMASKIDCKEASHVRSKLTKRLKEIDADQRHSITFDNGTEFAEADILGDKLDMDIYYGKPGCPQHRGTNENTNGLIRQFFPKGTDFSKVSHHQVKQVEESLNNRPRACLGFRTPNEDLNCTTDQLLCV